MTYALALVGATFGIGLIVLLNIAMGWTRLRLNSEETAKRFLKRDVMGFVVGGEQALTPDRRGYLCLEANGARVGLVLARGDNAVVRALRAGEIRSVDVQGSTLTITMYDYTLPRAVLDLGREGQTQDWADRLEAFVRQPRRASRKEAQHAESA
ncbi:hypothetical protein ACFELO_11745 [Oceanicaulis sp. LC35]|uniref:hypothetical protein n=1 Tax=Oceanicaulis sp. LC35 TaxID=3349635 RepID=UPI003F84DEA5